MHFLIYCQALKTRTLRDSAIDHLVIWLIGQLKGRAFDRSAASSTDQINQMNN
jgi:hypothetical protein